MEGQISCQTDEDFVKKLLSTLKEGLMKPILLYFLLNITFFFSTVSENIYFS